jgi:hypothetical protein
MDLTICATVQPTERAASAALRVPSGKACIVSPWPAATSASRTLSTEFFAITDPLSLSL